MHQTYKRGRRKIGKPSKNFISYNKKQYKKYSDMARDYNITPRRLFKRLSNGWSLDEALYIPIKRKEHRLKKKLYMYNGKLMSTKQLAALTGLTDSAIRHRLERGWSIEEAVEIPLGRRRKNV